MFESLFGAEMPLPVRFFIAFVIVLVLIGVVAWLVRRFAPFASGSGIPHVEAVLLEELPQAPSRLIPVKFLGGVVAIGSGLALGREGPSVQMGATLAHLIGRIFRRGVPDCLVLLAAGAGAGLATAFNAPKLTVRSLTSTALLTTTEPRRFYQCTFACSVGWHS